MTVHEITLHAMRFHALVGILPHERSAPQPIEVDLCVRIEGARNGEGGVVDYRSLYDVVARVIGAGHIDFLEEIGERIADRVLEQHERVRAVRVAVRKPHVSLPGPLGYAEVVVERHAGDA